MSDVVPDHLLVEAREMRNEDELRRLEAKANNLLRLHRSFGKRVLRESGKVLEGGTTTLRVPGAGEQTPIRYGEAGILDDAPKSGFVKELTIRESAVDSGRIAGTKLESKPSLR
ncbi:unnamed protein product [Thlaspi arvense]|uniref:Uncharacterized protein n=1 Tax=Thlaspi arvense TaxID=13288 RepID=A0AAU9R7D8_THLAR|nr:unnamed protein product [Thlaspi arvense]